MTNILPENLSSATLLGRVWDSANAVPRVVTIKDDQVLDLSGAYRTMSDLLEEDSPVRSIQDFPQARVLCTVAELLDWSENRDTASEQPFRLLAPLDLQVIKACGVTFVESMVERVIEEQAAGDASKAGEIRSRLAERISSDLSNIVPASPEAEKLKEALKEEGIWSQYLEVGIGKDPEVFSKAPVLSSAGTFDDIGIPDFSSWNNPEPELVLAVNSKGKIQGVTLGNDVNLRDVEGRSALLLGLAKDNNASCAIGPFIRLFDEKYSIEDARNEEISLAVEGTEGFRMEGKNQVSKISRPLEDLVSAVIGVNHQYPDGFLLFTGTLFAPIQDRTEPGLGFTHFAGDKVTISSPNLGALVNTVRPTKELEPWTFGIRSFFDSLKSL